MAASCTFCDFLALNIRFYHLYSAQTNHCTKTHDLFNLFQMVLIVISQGSFDPTIQIDIFSYA
jgi:hypothetical protein